jgi:hypothetical protein
MGKNESAASYPEDAHCPRLRFRLVCIGLQSHYLDASWVRLLPGALRFQITSACFSIRVTVE